VRFDASGNILWQRDNFNFSCACEADSNARGYPEYFEYKFFYVKETSDNGFIIGGDCDYVMSGYPDYIGRPVFIKTNCDGDSLWKSEYISTDLNTRFWWLEETSDQGFILCTETGEGSKIARYTEWGDTLWTRNYGGSCIKQTSDNGYIVVAMDDSILLRKINELGDIVWTKSFLYE
jgi:hypothetical protein